VALDPNMPFPIWDGPWPPDESWDAPLAPAPPVPEVPAEWNETPVPDVAFAPVDPPAAGPEQLAGGAAPPPDAAPWDADLIEIGLPDVDLSGLAAPAATAAPAADEPWDADLIQFEDEAGALPDEVAPTEPTDEQRQADLAAQDPVQFAQTQAKHDMAREHEAATQRLAAAEADRTRAEENERVYREATQRARANTDAINAEADRLATEKVDPDGWQDSRGLLKTIASFVVGVVGGLVQSRQGGPNQGLAMINQAIERHIDAQKTNLAHRREMLGRKQATAAEAAARVEHDYRTEEAFRQAAWARALEDIESRRMLFDPKGTQALKLEGVAREVGAQLAASKQAQFDRTLKQEIEIGRYRLDVAKQQAEAQARRQAAANAAAARARADRQFAYQQQQDEKKLKLEYDKLDAQKDEKAAERAAQADLRSFDREVPDLVTVVKDADGKEVQQPYKARNKEAGDKIVTIKAARDQLNRDLQEVIRIRENYGTLEAAQNSPDFQRLNSLLANAGIAYSKLYQMGAYDKGTAEVTNKVFGGSPMSGSFAADAITTLWKETNPRAGIEQARKVINEKFNSEAENARDPRGGKFVPLELEEATPPGAPADPDVQAIGSRVAAFGNPFRPLDPEQLTRDSELDLEDLRDRIEAGDTKAAADLRNLATSAPTGAARAAAAKVLVELYAAGDPLAPTLDEVKALFPSRRRKKGKE
jgi:uncharacterized membrane-anchored protein YhcB (DUF1043 family)